MLMDHPLLNWLLVVLFGALVIPLGSAALSRYLAERNNSLLKQEGCPPAERCRNFHKLCWPCHGAFLLIVLLLSGGWYRTPAQLATFIVVLVVGGVFWATMIEVVLSLVGNSSESHRFFDEDNNFELDSVRNLA